MGGVWRKVEAIAGTQAELLCAGLNSEGDRAGEAVEDLVVTVAVCCIAVERGITPPVWLEAFGGEDRVEGRLGRRCVVGPGGEPGLLRRASHGRCPGEQGLAESAPVCSRAECLRLDISPS